MKKGYILLSVLVLFLVNCASRKGLTTNYYILQYFKHSEDKEIFQETPFNYSAIVYDADISRTYDRKKIVIRHFGPKITYANNDLWASDLSEGIAELVANRVSAYNIFNQVQRSFRDVRPDYEINTSVNNLEYIQSDNINEVHINLELFLTRSGEEEFLVKHSASREELLFNNSMESFVQKANEIILEEVDQFSKKIQNHFNGEPQKVEEAPQISKIDTADYSGMEMGKLLFPALTETDNEPKYKIIDQTEQITFAEPGQEIALKAGTYDLVYGSGSELQKMQKENVNIKPMYSTVIKPDWACLLVDVLDERRNYRQVRYEIFDGISGESYGTHYPVKKELGEQQRVWMLEPGLYKITINNEPFNSYRDFTTVYLRPGKVERINLVVGVDNNDNPTNLIGAGVMDGPGGEILAENWRVSSALHGNFNMNSNNETDKDDYFTTTVVTSQFENKLIYNNMPHYYYMRNLMELGFTKSTDVDLRLSADDFDLKNTYVLFLLKKLGLYGRFDINSHFFSSYKYSTTKFNYIKKDKSGEEIERNVAIDEMQISNGLYPLILKEGIGINYRLFNTPKAKLNIRTGLGIRQELYDGVYNLVDKEYYDVAENKFYQVYREMDNIFNRGTEISLVGNFNLPFNLSYMTNADVLFPFDKSEDVTVDWENVFNLRLFKHISIYYKLNLQNRRTEQGSEYILNRHSLFLRLTYIFR